MLLACSTTGRAACLGHTPKMQQQLSVTRTHLSALAAVLLRDGSLFLHAALADEGVQAAVAAKLHLLQLLVRPSIHRHRPAQPRSSVRHTTSIDYQFIKRHMCAWAAQAWGGRRCGASRVVRYARAYLTKLRCTPSPRCLPLHSRHMNVPYETDAHCGFFVGQSTQTCTRAHEVKAGCHSPTAGANAGAGHQKGSPCFQVCSAVPVRLSMPVAMPCCRSRVLHARPDTRKLAQNSWRVQAQQ